MLRGRLLPAFLAVTLAVGASGAAAAQPAPLGDEAESRVAAINGAAGRLGRQTVIPKVLSDSDLQHYRAAAGYSEHRQWPAADRELARLQDPLLLGHFLARRYLSDGYQPQPEELKRWMARYADQPEAESIYGLAVQQGVRGIRQPVREGLPTVDSRDDAPDWQDFSVERATGSADRRVRDLKERFRRAVREDRLSAANALLDSAETSRQFEKADCDELKTVLAAAHFKAGRDDEAVSLAVPAADRSGDVLPQAHWLSGLALWRSGDRVASLRHFEAVGNARDISSWLVAAGSYWAARANLTLRRPELVNHWLQKAAAYPRTFYGLLARRALSQDIQYSWESRPFTDADADVLLRVTGARRALALIQLDDKGAAEDELARLSGTAGPALAQAMLALTYTGDMPSLAVRLGGLVAARDGRLHDSADYPLPDWRPTSGWAVDRALVLAIARQESGFNPHARSPSGAVGLMQLMPQTARSMGGGGKLTNPQLNLEIGQRYVKYLLQDDSIKGNLLFLAASYNSGPGNLSRWLQTIRHQGDPLLFLESIPVRETRVFVQQVMTNYWAYRNRLGQTSPSLDAIAGGDWPMYDGAKTRIEAVNYVKGK